MGEAEWEGQEGTAVAGVEFTHCHPSLTYTRGFTHATLPLSLLHSRPPSFPPPALKRETPPPIVPSSHSFSQHRR